ncbi:hypothetical protein NPIL_633311 [Nephila pilipes]|uniref:Uncharacterized protein n=1 Tax=Nephila pilipes TaxID=299642 RepID=A0A8X6NTN8_NEPPI|nr:hypothetical protein NPIL_633311 [Nephila pilipes]
MNTKGISMMERNDQRPSCCPSAPDAHRWVFYALWHHDAEQRRKDSSQVIHTRRNKVGTLGDRKCCQQIQEGKRKEKDTEDPRWATCSVPHTKTIACKKTEKANSGKESYPFEDV